MTKLSISRKITINKPASDVYNVLSDFHQWKTWSPWLIQEPETEISVSDDGKFYSWNGNLTGVGNMLIVDQKQDAYLHHDLTFIKPWKSTAKVKFDLEAVGEGTVVTWSMNSSLPFFLFWMKGMMEALVGMDYERGLAMLKDYVEDGEVHSKLDFQDTSDLNGFKYVGIRTETTRKQIGQSMKADFERLAAFCNDNQDKIAGEPFSIYHKWDMIKGDVIYTSGFPVKTIPEGLADGFVTGELPSTKVYSIKHTGPYEHLGNAWSTLFNMKQNKFFRTNKKIDPFEIYKNDPAKVDPNQLETVVSFAVK